MKLQIQGQTLRFRIDEAELARLLDAGTILNTTRLGTDRLFSQSLAVHAETAPALEAGVDRWSLRLPRAALDDYVTRLPCRDALAFELPLPDGGTLSLRFEVDVRDSVQARGPRRRDRGDR